MDKGGHHSHILGLMLAFYYIAQRSFFYFVQEWKAEETPKGKENNNINLQESSEMLHFCLCLPSNANIKLND